MPAKIYTDKDADLAALKGKTLAVLGFGSQGHAHALNLKDSGCKVIIGLYPGSKSRKVAEDYGFPVHDTAEAVKLADVIMVGIPDTKQAAAYNKDIGPNLAKGKTLLFTHGFSIHFKTVVPPEGRQRHHGCSQRARAYRAQTVYRGQGRAGSYRRLSRPRQGR